MRRYDEPVQVQTVAAPAPGCSDSAPRAFLWRGRVYAVQEVHGSWHERAPWWRDDDGDDRELASRARGRHVWRVQAQAGRHGATGVFELSAPAAGDQPWVLARTLD